MTSFLDKRVGDGEAKAKKATLRRARMLSETKNWYADRHQSVSVQRNALFIFVLLLLAGLGFSVMMIAQLTNSKTFEPFVVEVDDKSGVITQVTTQTVEQFSADEAVLRAMLVQYVRAREGYDAENFRNNYMQVVRLYSAPPVYGEFVKVVFSATNKDSPVNFGASKRREVQIKSLTFMDATKRKVQIRMALNDIMLPGRDVAARHNVVAIITFAFKNLDLSPEERYTNPLGFQIQSYLLEEEHVDESDQKK